MKPLFSGAMSAWLKFLIGLAVALGAGAISHGPAGRGEAFVAKLEAQAQAAVRASGVPDVRVRLGRDPLSRHATLSGEADPFQREGQGSLPGINQRVAAIPGISGLSWEGE